MRIYFVWLLIIQGEASVDLTEGKWLCSRNFGQAFIGIRKKSREEEVVIPWVLECPQGLAYDLNQGLIDIDSLFEDQGEVNYSGEVFEGDSLNNSSLILTCKVKGRSINLVKWQKWDPNSISKSCNQARFLFSSVIFSD